jgi:2,3-bisphosphoglycerate-independent phosphoglycerate mutase
VIVVQDANGMRLRDGGSLRDIAPTMLGILQVPVPNEMTGEDLRML